jgi:hypothetical protein
MGSEATAKRRRTQKRCATAGDSYRCIRQPSSSGGSTERGQRRTRWTRSSPRTTPPRRSRFHKGVSPPQTARAPVAHERSHANARPQPMRCKSFKTCHATCVLASLMHAIRSGRRTHSRFAMMQPAREIAFPNRRDNSGGRGRAARAWRASGAVALNVVLVVPAVAIKVVPETSARHSSRADEQGDSIDATQRCL